MPLNDSTSMDTGRFVAELDAAVEAHMDWTRRVLRCAVLKISPGEQMLAAEAHGVCHFGRWFAAARTGFERFDARQTERLDEVHRAMHDAIRSICADVMAGRPGQIEHLERFEQAQAELIRLLATFKTRFLADAVQVDALTGLPLRHGMALEFEQARKNVRRNHTRFYVAMIDIDHFKRVNDTYGHLVGDVALRHLADTLRPIVRPSDHLYRFGGEEFLLLMQVPDHADAVVTAERLVDAVRRSPVPAPGLPPFPLTVTLGLAFVPDGETLDQAVERADRAMYEGKQAGRDRVSVANP